MQRVPNPLTFLLVLCPVCASAGQQTLSPGTVLIDRLTDTDPRLSSAPGGPFKTYVVNADRGDTLTIELTSDDFDARLVVTDTAGRRLEADDSGAGACNARLTLAPRRPTTYRVLSSASTPFGIGTYRLALTRGHPPAPPKQAKCAAFLGIVGMLQVGQAVRDTIEPADRQFRDSTRFRRYVLPLDSGQTVTIDLHSDDFDAFLILERGRGEMLQSSTHGAGGCNARLVYHAPEHRPVIVVANTARPRQRGAFTLRVSAGAQRLESAGGCRGEDTVRIAAAAAPPPRSPGASRSDPSVGPRTIAVGQAALGEVTVQDVPLPSDGTYTQDWLLEGEAGQTLTIDLQSDEFDPFLYLVGPGIERWIQDDDSGGNCNARISTTLPATGSYRIIVNTAVRNTFGRFSLTVSPGSTPPSLARCARVQ
jgi:hypothetical protein